MPIRSVDLPIAVTVRFVYADRQERGTPMPVRGASVGIARRYMAEGVPRWSDTVWRRTDRRGVTEFRLPDRSLYRFTSVVRGVRQNVEFPILEDGVTVTLKVCPDGTLAAEGDYT